MRIKAMLVNLGVFTTSVSFILLFFEVAVRIFYTPVERDIGHFNLKSSSYYQQDDQLGWLPSKNVTGIHNKKGSFKSSFNTNSRGLRDKEYDIEKPETVSRFVILGDSFTWGFGVDDDEVYTEILEATFTNIEVINLGVTAFGTQQEFNYLKTEGIVYGPDVVILAFALNDIFREKFFNTSKKLDDNNDVIARNKNLLASDSHGPHFTNFSVRLKKMVNRSSFLYNFITDRVNTNKKLVNLLVGLHIKDSLSGFEDLNINLMPGLKLYPESLKQSFTETQSDLLAIQGFCRSRRIRFVLALVPSLQWVDERAFRHSIAYKSYDPEDFDLEKPYRLLVEFCRKSNIEVINPIHAFKEKHNAGSRLFLRGDMHFNKFGHELFANEIAEFLKEKDYIREELAGQ